LARCQGHRTLRSQASTTLRRDLLSAPRSISSSGFLRVVTSPLTSKPDLSPRFLRPISGSLRWDTYLSILECPPPGGSPDLKNQSCTGCGQRLRQNHLTSADKSIERCPARGGSAILHFHDRFLSNVTGMPSRRPKLGLRMSFVFRHIPYTCTAPEPALEPLRRDLARRILRICSLYASCPA
jgi:hypothetical protein